MLEKIFGKVGNTAGKAYGGGIFSSIGSYMGNWLGGFLEEENINEYYKIGKTIDNVFPESNIYGTPIPIIFGIGKVSGRLIWAREITSKILNSTDVKYFSHSTSVYYKTEFLYYADFAIAICDGEVESIERVWCNNKIINLGNYNYRFYDGNEKQLPDKLILEDYGKDSPAFRGISYIIFESFPLEEFGNKIPNFSFEVKSKLKNNKKNQLNNRIKSLNIIPGSGEFVYDTEIVTKSEFFMGELSNILNINSHNHKNLPDALYNLQELKNTCSNLEWVAPVISWFGNNLDISKCEIYPAVEYKNDNSKTSTEWCVAEYNRQTAIEISKDEYGKPNYGGTVNDQSLIRYLKELKNQKLKIMLYPMIFLDLDQKPWRGHMFGDKNSVEEFFYKKNGYRNFILHYARLCKNLVNAFIIGSELKNLTKINDGGNFPFVNELIKLAKDVKEILGSNVVVTYAADWSEYHHTEGGWYHLDSLWASEYIDVVGIDNYFPLTHKNGKIEDEDIKKGFSSGEGYDYYFCEDQIFLLKEEYAWKNLRWWWSNLHKNPDGNFSKWVPKSKKIWFTEFGFPSIDKAPNQPNVFYDPKSVDGGVPIFSDGSVNFEIQAKSIELFYDFWSGEEYVENSFLWCWDARPQPAWPFSKSWNDGRLWSRGHWINNKFKTSNLNDVIYEICKRSGIEFDISQNFTMDNSFKGMVLNKNYTGLQILSFLRCAYFFDIIDLEMGKISFQQRNIDKIYEIFEEDFIKTEENKFFNEINLEKNLQIQKLSISYIDAQMDYLVNYVLSNKNYLRSEKSTYHLNLPIVSDYASSLDLASKILANIKSENRILKFRLPVIYIDLQISDILKLNYEKTFLYVRITDIFLNENFLDITAVKYENLNYKNNFNHADSLEEEFSIEKTIFEYNHEIQAFKEQVSLFYNLNEIYNNNKIILYFLSYFSSKSKIYLSLNKKDFYFIDEINQENFKGKIIEYYNSNFQNSYLIDKSSYIIVEFERDVNFDNVEFLSEKSLLKISEEVISFENYKKISNKKIKFYNFARGIFDSKIENFYQNQIVTTLVSPKKIEIDESISGAEIFYKTENNIIKEIKLPKKTYKIKTPEFKDLYFDRDYLYISWSAKSNIYDDWVGKELSEIEFSQIEIKYLDQDSNVMIIDSSLHDFKISQENHMDIRINSQKIIIITKNFQIFKKILPLPLSAAVEICIMLSDKYGNFSNKIQKEVKIL